MGRKGTLDKQNEGSGEEDKLKKEAHEEGAAEGAGGEIEAGGGDEGGKAEKKDGKGGKGGKKGGGKGKKMRKVLRKAVKEAIRKESALVAKALVHKVGEGDKRCTEMMFALIQKKGHDGAAAGHGGRTAADLLGSEEQWEDETAEAMERQGALVSDQGSGIRDQ
jgi:hypothetical protein